MGYVAIAMMAVSALATGFSIAGNAAAYQTAKRRADTGLSLYNQNLQMARSTGELQAQQQSAERTRRYADVISSQTAIWAARGIQLQSGTVRSIQDVSTRAYERDTETIELNRLNRLASLALQGASAQYEAAFTVGAAHSRMVTGIGQSLFNFASSGIQAGSGMTGGSSSAAAGGGMPSYGSSGLGTTPGTGGGAYGGAGGRPY